MERLPVKKGKKFWGEMWWDVLHSAAAFYTQDRANEFRLLIQGYKGNIPCKQCKVHFIQNLANHPIEPYLADAGKLLFWTYIMHDTVNQIHNSHRLEDPPKISPPFPKIVEKYTITPSEHWDTAWKFVLHTAAVVYTPEKADDYILLVKSFKGLIPSITSRVRFNQALEKVPVEPYSRNNHDVFFWSYVIANMVKPSSMLPYADTKRYYFAGLDEECETCNR